MQKFRPILALVLLLGFTGQAYSDMSSYLKNKGTQAAASAVGVGSVASGIDMAKGLIPNLTSALSITEDQATGGLGSIMKYAQSALSSDEGSALKDSVPGFDSLLAAVPSLSDGGGTGTLGKLSSLGGALGGGSGALSGLSLLTQQFSALGLSPDMIGKMSNMAVEYFSSASPSTGGLLKSALGDLLG
jgi:hypothetical protein